MSYTQLTESQRYQISALKEALFSMCKIEEELDTSASTVSR